jgi:hypothetical protein
MMDGREVEMTFDIDLSTVSLVYATFTRLPAQGRHVLRVRTKPARTVLHFYLGRADDAQVRRLRARRHHCQFVLSLESKRLLREDRFLIEKEEVTEIRDMPLGDAADLMSRGTPIISSFIKNQHRMVLESELGRLKVSLDQMLPFRADRPMVIASPFWHLELEEVHGWRLSDFLHSSFFQQNLSELRPLQKSKWRAATLGPPVRINEISRSYLPEYLDALLARGRAERRLTTPLIARDIALSRA